jgi:hypothetical protein
MYTANMNGARLAYVVKKLEGTVKREKVRMHLVKKGSGRTRDQWEMRKELIEEDAGYMVFFPRGHAMRVPTMKQLEHYNLARDGQLLKPTVINMSEWANPNSPIGRLMMAQDNEGRAGAMADMETLLIRMATHQSGPRLMPEQFIGQEAA